MNLFDPLKGSLSRQLAEARRLSAMRKAFRTVKDRQQYNRNRISDLEERRRRLRQTRERAVGDQPLLEQAVEHLEENGIKVLRAETATDALSLLLREIGEEKLVVKAKSNACKEIELTRALEERGIKVVETDIGDRIIQLTAEKPCHPTGPASHLSPREIARALSAHLGREVEPEPEALAGLLREEIAGYFARAKVGISGANAITAEEGALVLLHNEGNILEVMLRPRKHLILAGIEKIYPNLDEAINMAKLQTFYATGAPLTAFINIIGGPSRTADIEKRLIQGVHGPAEVCLILLDNHRSEIINSGYGELLYCIGCGECLLVCPAYGVYGSQFSGEGEPGGKGALLSTLWGKATGERELELCLNCGKCREHCPVSIDLPSLIRRLREEHRREVFPRPLDASLHFAASHLRWLGKAIQLETLLLLSRVMGLSAR
jgi:L-lactate dehydrogenase complex protein LldG